MFFLIILASLIRPKVVRSVHYCPATMKTIEKQYSDLTSLEAYPSSGAYPTKDADGNLLETEYGLSVYTDHQTLTVQVCCFYFYFRKCLKLHQLDNYLDLLMFY